MQKSTAFQSAHGASDALEFDTQRCRPARVNVVPCGRCRTIMCSPTGRAGTPRPTNGSIAGAGIGPGEEIGWGVWHVPESELRLLPEMDGLDVVELGCGTGYVSAWLARRGARPVGLDNSARQLATARMFQREFDLRFPLIHGDAERAPLRDASFDLAISEYGAAIWCDPYRWIPRGRPPAPTRRHADLPRTFVCLHAHVPRGRAPCRRDPGSAALRDASVRVARRRRAWSSRSLTAT